MTEKKVAVVEHSGVESLISQAIEKKLDIASLERLMAMREKYLADQARSAYFEALSNFQGECPTILKNKNGGTTNQGVVAYRYATLDAITEVANPFLSKHGLSYSFKADTSNGKVKVTCITRHIQGHSEESVMETDLGARTGIMSAPQQVAATVTFNKRYAFVNAFGIVIADEDDDSQIPRDSEPQESSKITPKQKVVLLLKDLGEPRQTADDVISSVERITKLKCEEKNLDEIISRLNIIKSERQNGSA